MDTRSQRRPLSYASVVTLAASFLPSVAHAHVGIGPAGGWAHGFAHPLTGLDHLCAMIAVGVLAVHHEGRSVWVLPLTFVATMAAGALLGMHGIGLPIAAGGVALSVVVFGLLVATALALPMGAEVVIVAVFALCHGHVHGTEMSATATGLAYGAGLVAATALLHATGIVLARLPSLRDFSPVRCGGLAMALYGLYALVV